MERHVDLTFIVPASASEGDDPDTVAAAVVQLLESKGAKIYWKDSLGKKKFTYPIKHETHGHYYSIYFDVDSEVLKEIEHEMRLNADVLRYLLVRVDKKPVEELEAEKVEREAYAQRQQEKEEADERKSRERHDKRRSGRKKGERAEKVTSMPDLDAVPKKKEAAPEIKKADPAEAPVKTSTEAVEVPEASAEDPTPGVMAEPSDSSEPMEVSQEEVSVTESEGETPAEVPEAPAEEEKEKEKKTELADLDAEKLDAILDKEIDI